MISWERLRCISFSWSLVNLFKIFVFFFFSFPVHLDHQLNKFIYFQSVQQILQLCKHFPAPVQSNISMLSNFVASFCHFLKAVLREWWGQRQWSKGAGRWLNGQRVPLRIFMSCVHRRDSFFGHQLTEINVDPLGVEEKKRRTWKWDRETEDVRPEQHQNRLLFPLRRRVKVKWRN